MRLTRYRLPLREPLRALTHREGLILRLERGGRVGTGEAAPLPGFSAETLDQCEAALRSGEDLPPSARFALELAMLDLEAQEAGVPLARLLGATRGEVPVNTLVAEPQPVPGAGVVKMKVGGRPLEQDLDRVRRQRALCAGPLRLDANRAWSLEEARVVLAALVDLGVECVEEPLRSPSPTALASLRGRGVAIAADESLRSAADLELLLHAQAVDVVVLKPMFIGALRETLAMARRAADAGWGVIFTSTIERAPGRLGALHLAAAAPGLWPCGLDTGSWLPEPSPDPTAARDGVIRLPQTPGLGLPERWS